MLNTNCSLDAPGPARSQPMTSSNLALEVFDEVSDGLIVCDIDATLHKANRRGWDELASESALKLVGETVRVAKGSNASFERALVDAAKRGRRCLLRLEGADLPMLAVIPLSAASDEQASVLLMMGRRSICSDLGLDMLGIAYRLSCAERKVLGALVANMPPSRIAARHGVAISTIRSQIKSVRNKLGVDNIEGLLVRAAEVPQVAIAWQRLASGRWRHGIADHETPPSGIGLTATMN